MVRRVFAEVGIAKNGGRFRESYEMQADLAVLDCTSRWVSPKRRRAVVKVGDVQPSQHLDGTPADARAE